MIAAKVGALANGTATSCVQLARLRPVTTYDTIISPMLVFLKIKPRKMIEMMSHAGKYADETDRCHELRPCRRSVSVKTYCRKVGRT